MKAEGYREDIMDFNIIDNCNLLEKMLQLLSGDSSKEYCAVAVAEVKELERVLLFDVNDYCMIEEVGGSTRKIRTTVPAKVSYVLLGSCVKNGYVPVIIHTHPLCNKQVDFSLQDMKFIDRFNEEGKKEGLRFSVFIVTDGVGIAYCVRNLETMEYMRKEEKYVTIK